MPFDDRPTSHDQPRLSATSSDINDYTLSIEEVAERYAKAGHPRTIRTLQRYCVSGHLDSRKVATTLGDKYFVTPQSVARHIAQIEELRPLDTVATNHDQSRQGAAIEHGNSAPNSIQVPGSDARHDAVEHDQSRPVASTEPPEPRYVERLEKEIERGNDEREFLREQINRKDKTIEALIERDRETNFLVRGLQEMLSPLLRPARRDPEPPQQ